MIRQKVFKVILTTEFKLCFQDPNIKEIHSISLEQLNKEGKLFKGVFDIRDSGDTLKRFAVFEWEENK